MRELQCFFLRDRGLNWGLNPTQRDSRIRLCRLHGLILARCHG
jgi:hypothetical protein